MNILKNLKSKINNWLERMAKENSKNFGTGKLDCCQMNRSTHYKNTNPHDKNQHGENI